MSNIVSWGPRVVGPYGNLLSIDSLPKGANIRWVRRRKEELVLAVRHGVIPLEDACARYALSPEEFEAWRRAFEKTAGAASGRPGFSVDKVGGQHGEAGQ